MSREKQLQLIVRQLQMRGSQDGGAKVTFAAVAKAAGVSTSLIHNHYPVIAELIREAQGRSTRKQRDAKHQALKDERLKSKILRKDIEDLKEKIRVLASINETLLAENSALRSRRGDPKVINLASRRTPTPSGPT